VGDLAPAPDGMVIGAGFRSARAAVATGRVPRWLAWMLPDPWDNIRQIRESDHAILLLHSRRDETIPFGMPRTWPMPRTRQAGWKCSKTFRMTRRSNPPS
jgi:hypothetical protein